MTCWCAHPTPDPGGNVCRRCGDRIDAPQVEQKAVSDGTIPDVDPLLDKAVEGFATGEFGRENELSTIFSLMRTMRIGYMRAARLWDAVKEREHDKG